MPSMSWITGSIAIDDHYSVPSCTDLVGIIEQPELQVSVVHEFVHFMQLVTSVAGVRLLADLVDLGVRGALLLSGAIKLGDIVSGYRKILPLLRELRDSAWTMDEGVAARRHETMDELDAMFQPMVWDYAGTKSTWEIDRQLVSFRSFEEPVWGFVIGSPSGPKFRPFSVGFLAESMARRLDRWFAARVAPAHRWTPSLTEVEFYNGLLGILSYAPRFADLSSHNLEEITVLIASLALATPRPDEATVLMLRRLEEPFTGGTLTCNVAAEFRNILRSKHLFSPQHYNEAITDIMWGTAQIMDRSEYLAIHRRLVMIYEAANRLFENPEYFVEPNLDWETVRRWMALFPPPPVVATDGLAEEIGECPCEPFATTFLTEVERALLRAAPATLQLTPGV